MAAVIASLAACASNAPPRFHSLLASAPTSVRVGAPPATTGTLSIVVAPVSVPPQVDQPQWLVRLPDDSLALLESERWAAPLRDELRQAVIDGLVTRFGAVEYRSTATDTPPWRVVIDVRRFESVPGLEARTEGTWSITGGAPSRPVSVRCEWVIREPVGDGIPALEAGHRRAAVRLADTIGTQLLRLGNGQPASCVVAGASPS